MRLSRRELLQAGVTAGVASSFSLPTSAATLPLLGLIAPPKDYPVPPEALALYGKNIRFTVYGLGLPTMTPEGYDSVIDKMLPAAKQQAREGASAIHLFGTSLTFYKGAKFNQQLIDQVKRETGLPTTSMSTAVIDGLKAVNAKRVAAATAYNDDVSGRLRTFLQEHGFEVVAMKGLGLEKIADPSQVTQPALQQFSADVYRSAPKADALVVSCGGLRTLEIIAPLEQTCHVPVVSSTPHALWAGMRLLGMHVKVPSYGQIIARG
jgi:arylmalonate decarboxylase